MTELRFLLAVSGREIGILVRFAYFAIWVYFTLYIVSYISGSCSSCYIDTEQTYADSYPCFRSAAPLIENEMSTVSIAPRNTYM